MKSSKISCGDKFFNTQGSEFIILENTGWNKVLIKFSDCAGFETITSRQKVLNGSINNPYHRSVYGVGYLGVGGYKTGANGRNFKVSRVWNNILYRCYSEKSSETLPTYNDCAVHPDWHNFQVFAKWYEDNYVDGFELDKDLKIIGNRVYSENACTFVPAAINALLNACSKSRGDLPVGVTAERDCKYRARINMKGKSVSIGMFLSIEEASAAYCAAKNKYVSDMAEEYKDVIHPDVYKNLKNYDASSVA